MISLVNFHANATRIGKHLWEIDLGFAPGLSPGWIAPQYLLGLLLLLGLVVLLRPLAPRLLVPATLHTMDMFEFIQIMTRG